MKNPALHFLAGIFISTVALTPGQAREAGCRVLSGRNVVVVEAGPTPIKGGRLCIERQCSAVSIANGLAIKNAPLETGDIISFTPTGGVAGCVAVAEVRPGLQQQIWPLIVTGGVSIFATLAGLFGALAIEVYKARRDRRGRASEWIEACRRDLAAWIRQPGAEFIPPPLPALDYRAAQRLRSILINVEAVLAAMPASADRKTREATVDQALIILSAKHKV